MNLINRLRAVCFIVVLLAGCGHRTPNSNGPAVADRLLKKTSLPIVVDPDDAAADSLNLASGGLAIQDGSGRIAWVQPSVSTPDLVSLGAIVADVIQGVDVPNRVRQQWRQQIAAYQETLRQVTVKP
jgi:hypothetical protein